MLLGTMSFVYPFVGASLPIGDISAGDVGAGDVVGKMLAGGKIPGKMLAGGDKAYEVGAVVMYEVGAAGAAYDIVVG
jgi:hypothetical protein